MAFLSPLERVGGMLNNFMNVRIKFSKYGIVKFIGHLDVMRYFQKAIRRSGIDIVYSNGFNPHQIMSFASPLGVGLTSDGEYMDIELHSCDEPEVMTQQLNQVMNEGFTITKCIILPDPEPNRRKETAMSLVAAADYKISLKDGYTIFKAGKAISKEEIDTLFLEFIKQKPITVLKKSKKKEEELNIQPFIYGYGVSKQQFAALCEEKLEKIEEGICHADQYQTNISFYLRTAAGSVMNIKPELVIRAFFKKYGLSCDEFALQIHRMELFYQKALQGTSMQTEETPAAYLYLPLSSY